MWKKIKEQLNIEQDFVANESYPETQLSKIGKTAMKVLSLKDEEFYEGMGRYFVQLAIDIGYEKMLIQLGRGIRDFFLNLDNLHDYLKFTFPKMKAPSFFIDTEDETQIMMQYRTRRRGFHHYVQGQVIHLPKQISIFTPIQPFNRQTKNQLLKSSPGQGDIKTPLSKPRNAGQEAGM